MDASEFPDYHIERPFDSYRPRGFSDVAKTMEMRTAQLRRDVMRPPGGLAFHSVDIDNYAPTPPQAIERLKVRFRHGAVPHHFPITDVDEAE